MHITRSPSPTVVAVIIDATWPPSDHLRNQHLGCGWSRPAAPESTLNATGSNLCIQVAARLGRIASLAV